jgi:hypothetical protein
LREKFGTRRRDADQRRQRDKRRAPFVFRPLVFAVSSFFHRRAFFAFLFISRRRFLLFDVILPDSTRRFKRSRRFLAEFFSRVGFR